VQNIWVASHSTASVVFLSLTGAITTAENFEDMMSGVLEGGEALLMQLEVSTWIELVKSDEVNVTR